MPSPAEPFISIIAARAANGVIGRDGDLPWRLKSDLARFKAITMGKPVLMGRKTWDSLPRRPLPGRANIVLSSDGALKTPGAWVFPSLSCGLTAAQAMAARDGAEEVCVIGGQGVFADTLPLAKRLYLTEVKARLDGDAFFPSFDETRWTEASRQDFAPGPGDDCAVTLRTLHRRAPHAS